jgi:hypothetical protein
MASPKTFLLIEFDPLNVGFFDLILIGLIEVISWNLKSTAENTFGVSLTDSTR